jgi:hypothetical protein
VDTTGSARFRYVGWAMWLAGIGLLLVALWWAAGPWSVHVYGQSSGCGSAFMGRFIGGSRDPMASAAYACHDQAGNRRLMALLFGGFGAALIAVALVRQATRNRHLKAMTNT